MNGDGKTKYYEVNTSLMKPTNNPYIVFPKRNKEGVECKSLNDMLNDEKLTCSMPYVYCGQQSVNKLEDKTSRLFRKGKNDTYFIPGTKVNKLNGSIEATTIGHEVIFVTTNKTLKGTTKIKREKNEKINKLN